MTAAEQKVLHATCVEIGSAGIMLRGKPGSGKSDLALRLIDGGARLVADDQVIVSLERGRIIARPPSTILGRLEVRGIGIIDVPVVKKAKLQLIVDLVPADQVPRLPDRRQEDILGVPVNLIALSPFDASAAAKLRLAVKAFGQKKFRHNIAGAK